MVYRKVFIFSSSLLISFMNGGRKKGRDFSPQARNPNLNPLLRWMCCQRGGNGAAQRGCRFWPLTQRCSSDSKRSTSVKLVSSFGEMDWISAELSTWGSCSKREDGEAISFVGYSTVTALRLIISPKHVNVIPSPSFQPWEWSRAEGPGWCVSTGIYFSSFQSIWFRVVVFFCSVKAADCSQTVRLYWLECVSVMTQLRAFIKFSV